MAISNILGTAVANVSHVLGTVKANVTAILGATVGFVSFFTDDFSTIDTGKWTPTANADFSVTSSGGNLAIATDASFSSADLGRLISVNTYNGTGKTITIEGITSWFGGSGVDGGCFICFFDSANSGHRAQLELQAGLNNLRSVVTTNFVANESNLNAFNVATDTGLRVEHVNPGNTYKFYVKRSGVWTLLFTGSFSPSWNLNSARVRIEAYTNSGSGTTNKSFTVGSFDSNLS